MEIVPLEEKHLTELVNLAQHTFEYSYQGLFKGHPDEADFKKYLTTAFTTSSFRNQMQENLSKFYGVFHEDSLIAYLKLNDPGAQSIDDIENSLEIERIYIHESQQGKGIGAQLISFSKERAKDLGRQTLWLLVWERNVKAKIFYEKMGFAITGGINYKFAEPELDHLMRIDL